MSEGIRSGVNWTRLKERPRARLNDLMSRVLPRPGTPSSSTCPPEKKAMRILRITSAWLTMTFRTSASSEENCSRYFSGYIFSYLSNQATVLQGQGLLFEIGRAYV